MDFSKFKIGDVLLRIHGLSVFQEVRQLYKESLFIGNEKELPITKLKTLLKMIQLEQSMGSDDITIVIPLKKQLSSVCQHIVKLNCKEKPEILIEAENLLSNKKI